MSLNADWGSVEVVEEMLVGEGCDGVDVAFFVTLASETLFALSGRRWPGVQEDETVYRPVSNARCSISANHPVVWDSRTIQGHHLSCMRRCRLDRIRIPGPVNDVTEVRLDGVVLDETAYRVERNSWLVRLDGAYWPCCQDLSREADQPDTFQVTYHRGLAPSSTGVHCANLLAAEMVRAACLSGDCQLPVGTTSLIREGVTYDIEAVADTFWEGRTGIAPVDLWLSNTNPHHRTRRAGVYRADDPRRRHA